jgi:hypothetical protein
MRRKTALSIQDTNTNGVMQWLFLVLGAVARLAGY